MTVPLVSVILPFRNAERFLGAALGSLGRQDFTDFEIVAVDDGSEDGSAELAARASQADPRLRVLRATRRGLPHALNDGCGAARGRYLARMDADDIALPTRLSRQVAALTAASDIAVVGGSVDLIDEDDRLVGEIWYAVTDAEARAVLARGSTPFCHPAATIRRDAFESVGGYRGECELAEDLDLWLRIAPLGRLYNLDEKVLQYRLHPSSSSYDRVLTQVRSFYRTLAINTDRFTADTRAWARETDETWRLVSLWAPDQPADHLGRNTSWYVEQAVTAGYDAHIDALIAAIAGVAPPAERATVAWTLWQAAAGAAIAAGRYDAARAHMERGAIMLGRAERLDLGAPALDALTEAGHTSLTVATATGAPPPERTGGFLDRVHWFAGGTRVFLFGWIARPTGSPGLELRVHVDGPAPVLLAVERAVRHDVARGMGPAFIIAGFKVDLRFSTPADPARTTIRASVRYADGTTAALEDAHVLVRWPEPVRPER